MNEELTIKIDQFSAKWQEAAQKSQWSLMALFANEIQYLEDQIEKESQ